MSDPTRLIVGRWAKVAASAALSFFAGCWVLGCVVGGRWLFDAYSQTASWFWLGVVICSIPLTIGVFVETCRTEGGLSLGELIGIPVFCCVFTPLVFVGWPVLLDMHFHEQWFPRVDKTKKNLIRCRRRP